jgi:acyl carrier protein
VLAELRQAAPAARLNLLESHLRERLAQVLRIEPSRVGRHEPFRALGLDSLLSLELRNRIEVALELKLSAALLWAHSTLAALATHLLEQVGLAPGSEAPAEPQPQPAVAEPQHNVVQRPAEKDVEQLASLSEEKLLELMDDALASLEDVS